MRVSQRDSPQVTALGAPRRELGKALRQSMAICRRNLMQLKGEPAQALDVITPMLLAVIFIFAFGGAIGGGTDYKQYLLPGIMIQAVAIVSMATGIGLNLDFSTGMMDRFRSIPIARSSVLIGRIAADLCRMALGVVLVFVFALVIGFRVVGGPLAVVGAFLLMLAFGTALSWISAFVGLVIRSPQTVQSMGFVWMIPLQFGSSLYVPTSTMPGWLRVFVELNPMTLICDASRGLLLGVSAADSVAGSVAWIAGLIVVFAPLAVLRYVRRV